MKLCKDCKHFIESPSTFILDYCRHPKLGINPVYGNINPILAEAMRMDYEDRISCGIEGKWWEPKPPVKHKTFWAKLWS